MKQYLLVHRLLPSLERSPHPRRTRLSLSPRKKKEKEKRRAKKVYGPALFTQSPIKIESKGQGEEGRWKETEEGEEGKESQADDQQEWQRTPGPYLVRRQPSQYGLHSSLTWIATILKNPNLLKKLFSKYGEIDNFRFRYFPCWRLHFLALSPWTVLPSSTTLKRRSARYFQIQNHHSRLVFSPATWVMKSNVWTPTLSTRPPRASSRPRKWTTTYIVKRSCWFLSC